MYVKEKVVKNQVQVEVEGKQDKVNRVHRMIEFVGYTLSLY